MDIKVVIRRRKPGTLSESEARSQRLTQNLTQEERYIEELIDARENGRDDPFTSGSVQVARYYAKQLGIMLWIDGCVPTGEGPIQHLVGRNQVHGFFQLYSLEQMEARLQQIMKTIKVDQLFVCQANQPPHAGITYMRGYGQKTTVTNITWALNRAGKLIPQVLIQPIKIGGRTFNKVTGHHVRFIATNGIGPGAQVRICQAGQSKPIIDAVLASEEPALPEPGTWTLVGHHAEPVAAPSAAAILARELKEAGIKGFAAAHIKAMIRAGIRKPSDIASIDLVPILGPKMGAKVKSGFPLNN